MKKHKIHETNQCVLCTHQNSVVYFRSFSSIYCFTAMNIEANEVFSFDVATIFEIDDTHC